MKVKIERMVYGGAGMGHSAEADGGTIEVPFCLRGELVEAMPAQASQSGADGRLMDVLEPSPQRRSPRCAHFGACGGCHYQHAFYGEQLEMKHGILREVVARAGVRELPKIEVHSGAEWGYRNRIRLRVEEVRGELRVGYSRRASNEFLAIRECPIAAPVLWRAAEGLLEIAKKNEVARRWILAMSEVEIFASPDECRVQMAFSLREVEKLRSAGALGAGSSTGFTAFCEGLREAVPELAGAGAEMDAELGRRVRRGWESVSWGATGISYETAQGQYWVTRGAFFQVNRFLVDELVRIAVEERSGELAWDLYAGVGLFSCALARQFASVVAVEAGEPAAGDLARMLAKTGTKHRAVRSTAVEFLRAAAVQRERPELIVLDPPRAGVGTEGCSLLLKMRAPEMVYVSCDPVTLARDLAELVEGGYGVREVHLVDLFPQTFHIETVVVLGRGTT